MNLVATYAVDYPRPSAHPTIRPWWGSSLDRSGLVGKPKMEVGARRVVEGSSSRHRDLPDDALVVMMKAGYRSALEELLHRYRRYITWACRDTLGPRAREEIVQDAISQALFDIAKGVSGLKGDTAAEFKGWIRVVSKNAAKRVAKNQTKTERREPPASEQTSGDDDSARAFDPVDAVDGFEDRVAENESLHRCLEALGADKPDQLRALLLAADGLSRALIASLMSDDERAVTEQSVKNWVFRARNTMAACLGEPEPNRAGA